MLTFSGHCLRGLIEFLLKKLANNDRDWANFANKHQSGVYIPHLYRDGGFFPSLKNKPLSKPAAKPIRECVFFTIWPQCEITRESRLVNYTSKGQETHLTGLPKAVFSGLLPASFLIIGRVEKLKEIEFECLTIDSASEEAILLQDLLGFGPDFLIDEFNPTEIKGQERDRILDFSQEVIAAWLLGEIEELAAKHSTLPTTIELARLAQSIYLKENQLEKLDPFQLAKPGDALRDISRRIELELFREFQRKKRSIELVRIVLGSTPIKMNATDVIKALLDNLPAIDALMLSASQQRKSRAGYSYEHHIETMLIGGNIPFEKQVVIHAKNDLILYCLR